MAHTIPDLNFDFDALEPHIEAKTMEIHHDKHHAGYVNKLNAALEGQDDLLELSVEDLLRNISKVDESIKQAVINNGGGHANHSLFWSILTPDSTEPSDELKSALGDLCGSFETFKEKFADEATGRFGSGWAWLVVNEDGSLEHRSTANQNSPLMDNQTPILGLDVWEHAYYLNYQNRRADYIDAFWNVVNWDKVDELYKEAVK